MIELIDMVYILQKRVEKGIVYFLKQIFFRAILLLTLWYIDNIYIFFYPVNLEFNILHERAY